MDLRLKDKVVVVTGGARGIGAGIVRMLAEEKAIPVVVGKDRADNEKIVAETGGACFHVVAELTDPAQCKKAIEETLDRFGRIEGIVNNAGINDGIDLEHGSYEGFMKSLHSNLVHYYLMAHHALPALKKNKGAIVNITSKVAETGQGATSAYAAANGGRNALTREWAAELLKYGIRVNGVVVAECLTPMYKEWLATLDDPEKTLKMITSRIPLGNRMTTTDEIASTVLFLLSERSSHTTGQLVHVDGGYVHLDRAISAKL